MPNRSAILYICAWMLYVLFSYTMFPVLNISVAIPIFFLVGIGAWLFGATTALCITAGAAVYHMILLSFIYPEEFETYQTKLTSPMLLITIAYLVGHLRKSYDQLKATYGRLDRLIIERNDRLHALTAKLLDDSENLKISRGQELHDGMGQQLTGIQLLSSSLSEQLLSETNTIASLAHHLKNQASRVHHQIRRISRLLFPVRIGQVGLIPALNELASCIAEIKPIMIEVAETHELSPIPERISLQLYRICQETTLYSADYLKADRINVVVEESRKNYRIRINHNGSSNQNKDHQGPFHLIEYRLKQINGKMTSSSMKSGYEQTEIFVPKQYADISEALR